MTAAEACQTNESIPLLLHAFFVDARELAFCGVKSRQKPPKDTDSDDTVLISYYRRLLFSYLVALLFISFRCFGRPKLAS